MKGLKPCPFCGGEADIVTEEDSPPLIRCASCRAQVPTVCTGDHGLISIGAWNRWKGTDAILEKLRKKRQDMWEETKAFVLSHRDKDGLLCKRDLREYYIRSGQVMMLGDIVKAMESGGGEGGC